MNASIDTLELAMDQPAPGLLGLAERGLLPDAAVRHGIRRMCAQRLAEEAVGGADAQSHRFSQRIAMLR